MTDDLLPQNFWPRVEYVTNSALDCGVLKSIPTNINVQQSICGDNTVDFQIRVVENLQRKEQYQKNHSQQKSTQHNLSNKSFDPFLPYEPELYVGEITADYRCLLNKFNVMNHHILMVTKVYQPQLTPLAIPDFLAIHRCLQTQNGLIFYNGGAAAGASVEHKHIQMIPLPFESKKSIKFSTPFPFASLFSALSLDIGVTKESALPFSHKITATHYSNSSSIETQLFSAKVNTRSYQQLLTALNLFTNNEGLMAPHNLLMTRDFMWIIPRGQAGYRGFGVNALGFAGTLLVKNETQLSQLRNMGCLALLAAVTN